MNNKTKQGIIYYRVSTKTQAEHGYSLDNQRDYCIEKAKHKNIDIIKEFYDAGASAKTINRIGLQNMLSFCTKNKKNIDYLIIYKIDRLSRNTEDYIAIKQILITLSIKLISVTEDINDTPSGKFLANLMASVAQLDNDNKSQRVTDGMKKALEAGKWPHEAPIGYINKQSIIGSKSIELDKKKHRYVKEIFEKYSTGNYTEEEIRQIVNKKGFKTKYGKKVSFQLIHKILINKFYMGVMMSYGGEYQGIHKPIISEDIFYKCQKLLRTKDKNYKITNEDFPLRNFVICGECNRPLTASYSTGKLGKKYPYYRCYNKKCLAKKSLAKKKVEEDFFNYLKEITPDKKYLEAFKIILKDVWENRYKEINKESELLKIKINDLEENKSRLIELVKDNVLDSEDFKKEYNKVKEDLYDKVSTLNEIKVEEFNINDVIDYCFNFISDIPKHWERLNYDKKLKLQGLIFTKNPVYTYPGFETQGLSLIFQQKKTYQDDKSLLVIPRGIEPRFPG